MGCVLTPVDFVDSHLIFNNPTESDLPASPSNSNSLILTFFEIRQILLEKGICRFRISGECMFPAIWPGDLLHIIPRRIEDIRTDDIAVFRIAERLFAHRTVSCGRTPDGQSYIITRGDASARPDSPVFASQLLGTVDKIERDGKVLSTEKRPSTIAARVRFRGHLLHTLFVKLLQRWRFPAYVFLVLNGFCGFLRRCFRASSQDIKTHVTIPYHHDFLGDLSWKLSAAEFVRLGQDRLADTNSFTLHAAGFGRSLGWLKFHRSTGPGRTWWLAGGHIAPDRYGILFLQDLWSSANAVFKALKVAEIYVEFDPRNRLHRYIFRHHGFFLMNENSRKLKAGEKAERSGSIYKKKVSNSH